MENIGCSRRWSGRLKGNALLLDVGANKGDWTEQALAYAAAISLPLSVKAFEPSIIRALFLKLDSKEILRLAYTMRRFRQAKVLQLFLLEGRVQVQIRLVRSLVMKTEKIQVTTLDQFLMDQMIDHVNFLKIDTEGFDALVIIGALESIESGKIDLIQFEYNWRWLLNSQSLRNVFQVIHGLPYQLGKLVGKRSVV